MKKGVVRGAVNHKTAGKISSALLQQTNPIPSNSPCGDLGLPYVPSLPPSASDCCGPLCMVR